MQRAIVLGVLALAVGPVTADAGSHVVDQTWRVQTGSYAGGVVIWKGTVSGPPFGAGTIVVRWVITSPSAIQATFTESFPKGTARGQLTFAYSPTALSGRGSFTGGTGVYSGASGPVTITWTSSGGRGNGKLMGTVSYGGSAPAPPPPPTGTATGTVLVNGQPFTGGTIPYGSTLDVTSGMLTMNSNVGTVAVYSDGVNPAQAVVTRTSELVKKKKQPLIQLTLTGGDFTTCTTPRRTSARAPSSGQTPNPKPIRSLWGKGKGHFRTKGRYSSATVRGTEWLTTDRCDGTLTSVTQGIVRVTDFTLKKTVTVTAGNNYLAPAP
jgi:hypothetical protein